MALDEHDLKIIREEGQDTRKTINDLREEVGRSNVLLREILNELVRLNLKHLL